MSEPYVQLVIIDPTRERHIALERAIITQIRNPRPKLHLFIGVDMETADTNAANPNLYRDSAWLKSITDMMDAEDLEYDYEFCWSGEWDEAIINCASRCKTFHIFMPDYRDRRRNVFTNQQWSLLRKSPVPVTIVRPEATGPRKKMLAAVNIQKQDNPKYAALNEKILTHGMEIAKRYGAEFHVINAYADSMNFPDREKLMRMTGLPTQNIRVEEGDPAEVISSYANEIGADTVVIGTLARSGALALMRGNTSEKVLGRITQDVITYS